MLKVNLRGLPGINRLSDSEREAFYEANQDILNSNNFVGPREMEKAAEVLYNNKQFVNKFGRDVFNQMSGNNAKDYEDRNALLQETIVNEAWNKYLSPFRADGSRDNQLGLGSLWEKYDDMSTDAKLKLLESDWQSPAEFKNDWDKYQKAYAREIQDRRANLPGYNIGFSITTGNESQVRMAGNKPKTLEDNSLKGKIKDFLGLVGGPEAERQKAQERNDKVLEDIYNEDLKTRASKLREVVSRNYFSPGLIDKSDDDVKKMFYNTFVDENSDLVKLGAGEFAAYWGQDELKDLSVDEMRQWLAKEKAYMYNMSPESAATTLNNAAKEYVNAHQSNWTKAGLYAKDFGTSAYSYLGDKVDGLYTIGLDIADRVEGSPTVYMNEAGEILDPQVLADPKSKVTRDVQGVQHYVDAKGNDHTVRAVQIPRTTLHQMGKNFDGSDAENDWLNPLYRTRVEQFGTFDADEQKQYEKLGVSPYKVAYDPGEESNFLWETAKMGVFGLVDMGSTLVPFGIGMLGRAAAAAKGASALTRTAGKVADFLGRGLSYETKVGQTIQGSAGAIGIAEAYGRGAFQETLAKNQADAEATIQERAQREIYNKYNSDKDYKKVIDTAINERASKLRQDYINQVQKDSNARIVDEKAVERYCHSQAQKQYLEELTQQRIGELKRSKDWATLQEEGIKHAGDAAMNTFYPESIKYLFVNNLGPRQFIYKNPTGLSKPVSSALKGIKEITTSEGRKRLVAEAPQFLTSDQKWKQLARKTGELGKITAKQAWGGAWTNGTDDMMTDGAERISMDSYSRYINGFLQGESLADFYGYTDGFYSYMKGLANSLGQDTTLDATLVGAAGAVFSGNINFTNLASLATKQGREAYKNAYQQRYKRNADGTVAKDAEGKPIIENLSWGDNWGQRATFFIQNGVLNNYYGKMQSYRSQQEHADFVNQILDEYNDFEDIENLVLSDRALNEVINEGDEKTARFIKALHTVNALNTLDNSKHDAATMSSVVEKAKQLIEETASMQFDANKDNLPEGEIIESMLSQYYAANPGKEQNAYTARQGLASMIKNAQKLQEAAEAYNKAEREISKVEQKSGQQFSFAVRERLKENHALDSHWRQRLAKMKEELGDASTTAEVPQSLLIPSLGGVANAEKLVRTYQQQEKQLTTIRDEQQKKMEEAQKKYDAAVAELSNNPDQTQQYALQKRVQETSVALEDAKLQLGYQNGQLVSTQQKMQNLQDALSSFKGEDKKERILTAQEIMTLNPVTRARMLRNEVIGINPKTGKSITTRDIYSEAQKQEIEKLEKQLLMKDSDALQKIQDIALLTQRIENNMDSYSKILKNPEAAAFRFEMQKNEAAKDAYNIINRRNAETLADYIHQLDDVLITHQEVTQAQKEKFVYNTLRGVKADVLEVLDSDGLLPKYQQQLNDAKDWAKILTDIDAVISQTDKGETWEENIRKNLNNIIATANTRNEVLAQLEKAIDDVKDSPVVADLELVMQGLKALKYQRDATVLEKRKERREREEAEKKKREEAKKAVKETSTEAAQVAIAEAATKTAEITKVQPEHAVPANGEGLVSPSISAEEAQAEHHVDEHSVEDKSKRQNVDLGEKIEDENNKDEKIEDNAVDEKVKDEKFPSQVEDQGDEVLVQSPDLQDQAFKHEGEQVYSTEGTEDDTTANTHGEQIAAFNVSTLSGNAMSEYEPEALETEGRLVHKKGASSTDSMSKFYGWMENAGIHLQNIIDHELAQILEKNPHAKVKFMTVNPTNNATHDVDVQSHLFLVLDYDSDINKGIEGIHKSENGGVIESDGKKYLIIGVVGYPRGNTDKQGLYDILNSNNPRSPYGYGLARKGRKKFFDEHPSERFMVIPDAETEIVANSLIPGFLVRQIEADKTVEYRNISELLKDRERNPHGLTMNDLLWGIQEKDRFILVKQGTSKEKPLEVHQEVMIPRKGDENTGRVFVLLPASNGKLIPSYLKPLFYNEMRDGALKDEIVQQLNNLVSLDATTRRDAAIALGKIFYLHAAGDFFLLSKTKPVITLVHDGVKFKTFRLDEHFDRQAFFDALSVVNPRINVTRKALQDAKSIAKLEEAGALTTDVALLGTVGSSYSIYGVDAQGKMLQPTKPSNPKPKHSDSGFIIDRTQVVYNHQYYTYENGQYYLHGIPVTDAAIVEQLTYNQKIVEGDYKSFNTAGVWDFYVLAEGANPEVVKLNKNTKEVVRCAIEEAQSILKKFEKQNEDAQRKQRAEMALKQSLQNALDADLGDGGIELSEDGSTVVATENSPFVKEETGTNEPTEQIEQTLATIAPVYHATSKTQNFSTLCRNLKYRTSVMKLINNKFKDAPRGVVALTEYLRKKNIEVDAIGTSEEDIQAWMKTIEECR